MLTIDKKWDCWQIAHNNSYIATLGNGISVWNRTTFELVHHFTGLRSIHGGIFVSDDILMVYTGEQKIIFLQISQKNLLWSVPRPRELNSCGDMHCCQIPGTETIACVARGRKALDEHFLLVVDWHSQKMSIERIPDCYRVVPQLVWTQEWGLSFLSEQAKGDNATILYRIHQVDAASGFKVLYDGESTKTFLAYSGHFLFWADYNSHPPKASVYKFELTAEGENLQFSEALYLPLPPRLTNGPIGTQRLILPNIMWIDENAGLMVACHKQNWVGIYDFINGRLLAERKNSKVMCGKLLDNNLLLGCASGFSVELLFHSA